MGSSTIPLSGYAAGSTCASGSGPGSEIYTFNGGCLTQTITSSKEGIVTMSILTSVGMQRGTSLWALSAVGLFVMVLLG